MKRFLSQENANQIFFLHFKFVTSGFLLLVCYRSKKQKNIYSKKHFQLFPTLQSIFRYQAMTIGIQQNIYFWTKN